jgi:hypothetical protein
MVPTGRRLGYRRVRHRVRVVQAVLGLGHGHRER